MSKLRKAITGLAILALLYACLVFLVGRQWPAGREPGWEAKLGDILWDELKQLYREEKDATLTLTLNEMVRHIAETNGMEADDIQVHVVRSYEPNAVTLPGNHIVVFTGLLRLTETPGELAAVLAHEMAHIQLNHISEKLMKEVSITVLVTAAGGGSEAGQVAASLLSNAFSRDAEQEADMHAITLLERACIDPQSLVDMLQHFADMEAGTPESMKWLSTHPLSAERVAYVTEAIAKKKSRQTYCKVPGADRWQAVKRAVE